MSALTKMFGTVNQDLKESLLTEIEKFKDSDDWRFENVTEAILGVFVLCQKLQDSHALEISDGDWAVTVAEVADIAIEFDEKWIEIFDDVMFFAMARFWLEIRHHINPDYLMEQFKGKFDKIGK